MMEAILFVLGFAFLVAVAVALGFAAIVYLRLRNPHSAALAKEKAQLVRKLEKDTPTSTIKEVPTPTKEKSEPMWRKTVGAHWPSVLLVTIGTFLFVWVSNNPIHLEDVGGWGADNRLLVIIVAGIVAGLIAFNEKAFGKAAKPLQQGVGVVALLMMFAMPLVDWYNSPPTARPTAATSPATQGRKMSGTLSMPANGDSEPLRVPPGCYANYTGDKFTTHCVYTDGREGVVGDPIHPCVDGPMTHSYVRDRSGKPNRVSYEIVCRR